MIEAIISWISELATTIQARHSVHPYVFLALSAVCGPLFYYSLFRMARALKRDRSNIGPWSLLFLAATVIPYLYVLIFGRNLPWLVYLALIAAVGLGARQLFNKLRQGRNKEGSGRP